MVLIVSLVVVVEVVVEVVVVVVVGLQHSDSEQFSTQIDRLGQKPYKYTLTRRSYLWLYW